MQFKITMLLSDEKNQRLCRCAETVLYEVAGSFGHSFSLRYEKIGAASVKEYDAELTEETVEVCKECSGILLDDAFASGIEDLLDDLHIQLALHQYGVPLGMDQQQGYELWCGIVRSLDAASVKDAAECAFQAAERLLCSVTQVSPNGKTAKNWQDEMRVHALAHPECVTSAIDAPSAMETLICRPEKLGILLCPPYAGSIFQAAAQALCQEPSCTYSMYFGMEHQVFASCYQQNAEVVLSPIAMIMALSSMLRFSAKLEKEADCVDAAVHNVLQAGWRTPDMPCVNEDQIITPEDMVDLICEQISLAGQLLNGAGE